MADSSRQRLADGLLAVLLGTAALALYAATLAPTVLAGDGGEFQFVPYLLGMAHPTGYPLYCLLGWAWSHLVALGEPAYRLNLFSALGAAAAVGLLYPTTRALLRQALPGSRPHLGRLLAALAAATLAVTPTLWSQAVIAEVYGLHILIAVQLLYLVLIWGESGDNRLLLLAAAGFGLGLAHHRTTLLLAPALLAYVGLVDRQVFHQRRLVLGCLLLVLLPLLLYLYIPLRAPHTPYLRQPLAPGRELVLYENSAANLVDFVLGGPFGGSLDLTVDLGDRLAMAWGFLRDEIGWSGLLLALTGLIGLGWARRWALLALTGLAYALTVAFNLVYTIGDIYVLFVPSYLIAVLWMATGVATLVRLAGRLADGRRPLAALMVLPFLLAPLWMGLAHYRDVDQSGNTRARSRWEAILAEPLPADAVLVSNDRNDVMPLWYMQYVEGRRPDLLGLFPLITEDQPTIGHVLDLALDTGRPTYLIKEMPGIEVKVEVEAAGRLWHVIGPAARGEPAYDLDVAWGELVRLVGYDREPRSPHPGEDLEIRLYWAAERPLEARYHTFVHLLDGQGNKVAQSDRQPGGVHYPTDLWQPGERLRDDHRLIVPADAVPGIYRLLVGLYTLAGDGQLQPLAEVATIGQVAVKGTDQLQIGPLAQPPLANFDDQIELLDYETGLEDGVLAVTLQWRAIEPPAVDYTVFVHLLDDSGRTVAQHDGQPRGGAYPTSVWDAGEVVADRHLLDLPAGLAAGKGRLRVGLYRLETGRRLPVVGGGDSVELE